MRLCFKKLIVWSVVMVCALKLFAFGLHYPLAARVSGDAHQYLLIAQQFTSFSSVLGYAGERAVGFALIEFTVLQGLKTFTSLSGDDRRPWVDTICIILLITHIATAWFFSVWAQRTGLIKSPNFAFVLFFFLATYPAFIGHTTLPLTDALAVDLFLCAVIAMEASFKVKSRYQALLLSGIAAFFWALSILVRPGTLFAVVTALAIAGVISLSGARRMTIMIGVTVLGCTALLAPYFSNCMQKYGSFCLQSPQAFDVVSRAQDGLRGARVLWAKLPLSKGRIPTLPDKIMDTNYYQRCHLTSIVGTDESSWIGCLLTRPLTVPAFIVKKWIGLFDHFRFTPYLEKVTPFWLRWLSRAYDSLSWIGFALLFLPLALLTKKEYRSGIRELFMNNITPATLFVYSISMLAVHTVFHIEDRFGLPMVPLCAAMLMICAEKGIQAYRSSGLRSIGPPALYCFIAWALFVLQIIAWDSTAYRP